MAQFRKKPVVIEAVQYLGVVNPAGEIAFSDSPDWLMSAFKLSAGEKGALWLRPFGEDDVLMVGTLESPHEANVNDWIAKGIKGELYPIKPDIFAELYDPA